MVTSSYDTMAMTTAVRYLMTWSLRTTFPVTDSIEIIAAAHLMTFPGIDSNEIAAVWAP
jgi:hypothetical protein